MKRLAEGATRKAQRSLTKADEEESRCASSVGDVRLACASLDRELQTVVKEKEALVLAESLRKLEVVCIIFCAVYNDFFWCPQVTCLPKDL